MNIFLICPVRFAAPELKNNLDKYVRELENRGINVYYPPRDTNQIDETGLNICKSNRVAIFNSDEIHFTWDGKSQGCLFDLGMAFAYGKKIKIVNDLVPEDKCLGKSIYHMVVDWESCGAY